MDYQERLELVTRAFVARDQGDLPTYEAAVRAIYDETVDDPSPEAVALHTALSARADAVRAGGDQEKLEAMAAFGLVVLAEWVGCDPETIRRSIADAKKPR